MSAIEIRYFAGDIQLVPGQAVVIRQVSKAGDVLAERHATLCTIGTPSGPELGIDYGNGPARTVASLAGHVDVEVLP